MSLVDGKKLEALRDLKGKRQGAVAKEIGISQGAYSVREKTGSFSPEEITKICAFLGIKKEQIELNEDVRVNELTFLTNKAIQTESALKVLLGAMAEILAKQGGGNVTKIRADLESTVDSLSRQALEQLQGQK